MPQPPSVRASHLAGALVALAVSACIYDPGRRCGPAMTYVAETNTCVCDANAIAVIGGCQPCAPDEVPVEGLCACPPGQAKNADSVCEAVARLGDACDAETAPCHDGTMCCDFSGYGFGDACAEACP